MKKTALIFIFYFSTNFLFAQESKTPTPVNDSKKEQNKVNESETSSEKSALTEKQTDKKAEGVKETDIKLEAEKEPTIELERPFNFFAAAGINHRLNTLYNVTVSPVDNTIQFERVNKLLSGLSTGLVWNPFTFIYNRPYLDENGDIKRRNELYRTGASIALLVNIFQLSFSNQQVSYTNPIDVGFGFGYKKENFLILLTMEFTPLRQPRDYFIESYKDKNLTLTLAGAKEPVRSISTEDNSLFITKIYPSFGLKIAYAFGMQPKHPN